MANPTIFEYQIQDDQGLSNRSSLYVAYNGATATINSLIGAWLAFGALIDDVIDGQILGGRMTIQLEPDASWKAAAVNGNNVNQVLVANFNNDFNRYLTPLLLPSYSEAVLDANLQPDPTNTELAALVAAIIAGSGAIFPNSRDLHDLDALKEMFLTVRKVKGQKARTVVIP